MPDPSKTTYQKSPRFDTKPALFRANVLRGLCASLGRNKMPASHYLLIDPGSYQSVVFDFQLAHVHVVACSRQQRFKRERVCSIPLHFTVAVHSNFSLGGLTPMRCPVEKLLRVGDRCRLAIFARD